MSYGELFCSTKPGVTKRIFLFVIFQMYGRLPPGIKDIEGCLEYPPPPGFQRGLKLHRSEKNKFFYSERDLAINNLVYTSLLHLD